MTGRVVTMMLAVSTVLAVTPQAPAQEADGVRQDPVMLRFAERMAPYYPGSSFEVVSDDRQLTASGAYRTVAVERECDSRFLSGTATFLVDESTKTVWVGAVARLPLQGTNMGADAMRNFLEQFLPNALRENMRLKVRIDWDTGGHPTGAVIPFTLQVDTGYGEYPRVAAVTADGALLVLGGGWPLDRDPVDFRRELLASSELVMWDHEGGDGRPVSIVEFSDLECPACRAKWPLIGQVLEAEDLAARHGMVSLPLTSIHPWSFRAASATWCVAQQDPAMVLPFKELFYELQPDMEVSMVTDAARDFVAANGLDEQAFNDCYLRSPSLDAVHRQLALGGRLGVAATPTYFVDGWQVQVPDESWFGDLVRTLAAGEQP